MHATVTVTVTDDHDDHDQDDHDDHDQDDHDGHYQDDHDDHDHHDQDDHDDHDQSDHDDHALPWSAWTVVAHNDCRFAVRASNDNGEDRNSKKISWLMTSSPLPLRGPVKIQIDKYT